VADDGRGVDEAAIRRRAAVLGHHDGAVGELLFLPGLSTRERADDFGGQGIGLDIVRARARAAGGDVGVTWVRGGGGGGAPRLCGAGGGGGRVGGGGGGGGGGGALVGLTVDAVAEVVAGARDGTLLFDSEPEEVSVLTVPLGPLFAPSRLADRGWIAPDGRV